ncbi:hypothetical protein LQ318_11885 [Aliifodinibius salicampi]|uniref:Uncharacterized protein n=1 Tax=Fodinibius salicampi TaxID=1920655 RepID=A0ABT3Q0I9_9BACT|nr:hypothetical protein [Fodinibius salicampi]MCW9713601.1 hypothetical protein [Fodinibius salicampi]
MRLGEETSVQTLGAFLSRYYRYGCAKWVSGTEFEGIYYPGWREPVDEF